MTSFDCIVIGAGMVGGATAVALADLGLRVAIIDRQKAQPFDNSQPYDLRVSAISLGSEKLLDQLGAWQAIKQMRVCPYRRLGVWETEASYTEFSATEIEQSHLGYMVENNVVQLAIWQVMEQHSNITILCPEQIETLVHTERGVEVKLSSQTISGKLLVGADGGNSQVRQLANIGTTGWQYQQSAMLVHVETEAEQQDITWQQFFESGPLAMLPLESNQASLVWYHDDAEIQRLSQLTNEQLTEEVNTVFPKRLGKVKVVNKGAFPLHRKHANQYVKNNVVLVGDAAHSINPLAGQGVNLGFKDVKGLQLSLATAIGEGRSWYAEDTLASYEKSRRADNLAMMTGMDLLNKVFSATTPLPKMLRNAGLILANNLTPMKKKALAYACGL